MKLSKRILCIATFLVVAPFSLSYALDAFTISTDHIYGHKAGMALTFDVIQPTDNANGVGLLYMVSRGWVSSYFDLDKAMSDSEKQHGRFAVLIDKGYTLFMVRHGSSPYFKVPDAVGDVRRALRYIHYHAAEFAVDPDRLGVFGNSAGGHLALMLGTASDDGQTGAEDPVDRTPAKVAAVVAYYPPVDLRRATPPSTPSSPHNFDPDLQDGVSPILHVTPDDPPTLLIHGNQDKTVPLSHSEDIYDAFRAAGVPSRLVVIKGAGHGFPGAYGKEAAAALADWFDRYLRGLSAD